MLKILLTYGRFQILFRASTLIPERAEKINISSRVFCIKSFTGLFHCISFLLFGDYQKCFLTKCIADLGNALIFCCRYSVSNHFHCKCFLEKKLFLFLRSDILHPSITDYISVQLMKGIIFR